MRDAIVSDPDQTAEELTEAQRAEMISEFEATGIAVFRFGADRVAFETLNRYIAENNIPTFTEVDRTEGTVSINKRPFGSLEMF